MCPRFRAYHSWPRKNRRIDRPVSSLPGDIRRGTDLSAARFYGHTPRKLPVFTAISRIIADCALTGALIFYNTVPCVSRIFSKNFYTFFTGPELGNLGTIPCGPGFFLPQAPKAGTEGRGAAPALYLIYNESFSQRLRDCALLLQQQIACLVIEPQGVGASKPRIRGRLACPRGAHQPHPAAHIPAGCLIGQGLLPHV